MRPGDVITSVNRVPVATAADAIRELNEIEEGGVAFLLISRGNAQSVVRITRE